VCVTTLNDIHEAIDRESERRTELWRRLSESYDPAVAADLKAIDERLQSLWAEHRQFRANVRFGDRAKIVARARAEERLERAAA
jgi:hypothetical protein